MMVRWLYACGFLLALTACDNGSVPAVRTVAQAPDKAMADPAPAPVRKRVALVMKTLTNPFFVQMEQGARRAERALDVDLLVRTAAQETSIEQQIQIVDDMIAAKVDAIVIAPGDSQRLVPVLKTAIDAGIKVVNIDNRLDPEAIRQAGMAPVPFISVDNEKGAYAAVRYLVKGLTEPAEAVILEGIRSADNARQRLMGAQRAMAENPQVTLVASESANWKIDEGYTVSEALFARHPGVTLLFASNDMMGLGALKYLQDTGKTGVRVGGFDALDEAVVEVEAGRLAVTVDQQAAEQGFQGVAMAMRLINEEPTPDVVLVDTRLVTADSLKK
ncbi:sugar ABC transporter substrate-binding protein [Denitromonas halophila]|uniref:Sugar ABC transporter substrate-binding protein n=2 Tax=Denitromonas halophila TaxID=1629404 RepID=A0A557QJW3_9RHOO|nr:sugar ABC transporter substrate-binding protein [Denitromonas halophila]